VRNGLGEKALRGRENNSAILHCAEQRARFFLLSEYDTRVALKMLSETAIRQQPNGCMSVPQKSAAPKLPRARVPFRARGKSSRQFGCGPKMRGFEKLLRIHKAVNHIKRLAGWLKRMNAAQS
jgi:hypothetical protein